jgi:glucose-6-phosphate 1-dehydrogenase
MTGRARCEAPHVIVLFGATGDLAARKLLPGLFHLASVGLLHEDFRIVGTSPVALDDEGFVAHVEEAVARFGRTPPRGMAWDGFRSRLRYVPGDGSDLAGLADVVAEAREELGEGARSLLYLSIPPGAVAEVVSAIGRSGLATPDAAVVLEKPFGHDRASAIELNALLHSVFDEHQVFRIDHFLGKEDVQNVLALRFSNRLFEPMWNAEHIARVEIDVPETLGVEDRVAFYEATGAFRDMVVTHLFQVLGFVAMETPTTFDAHELRRHRREVFGAMVPLDPSRVVRGQYEGYRALPGVAPDSDTETLVALEVRIDNDRWRGVPFYLRTGKKMAEGRRTITVTLREPDHELFELAEAAANQLVVDVGEPGSITIVARTKEPGPDMVLGRAHLASDFRDDFDEGLELEAYERLLHDVLLGDGTLFNDAAGIERLWEVAAPLLADPPPVEPYAEGSWGPTRALELLGGPTWHLPDQARPSA